MIFFIIGPVCYERVPRSLDGKWTPEASLTILVLWIDFECVMDIWDRIGNKRIVWTNKSSEVPQGQIRHEPGRELSYKDRAHLIAPSSLRTRPNYLSLSCFAMKSNLLRATHQCCVGDFFASECQVRTGDCNSKVRSSTVCEHCPYT